MVLQNTNINKLEQINKFAADVYSNVKSSITWYDGSGNTDQDELGFPLGYLDPEGDDPGSPDISELSDPVVVASILANSFQDWLKVYSKVRNLHFKRVRERSGSYYPSGDLTEFDATQVTNMVDGALLPDPDTGADTGQQTSQFPYIEATAGEQGVIAGEDITANGFNDFITALYDKWNILKDNQIDYTFTYCHDSCHSSCHSSCHASGRGRR